MATKKQLLDRIEDGIAAGSPTPRRVGDVYRCTNRGSPSLRIVISPEGHVACGDNGLYFDGGTPTAYDEFGLVDIGRRVIDGGYRGDSTRRHAIVEVAPGVFRYIAGCRCFVTLRDALNHWAPGNSRSAERPLKRKMVRNLFRQAALLGWVNYAVAGLAPKKPSHRRARLRR